MKLRTLIQIIATVLTLTTAPVKASVGLVFGDMTCKDWKSTPPSLAKGAWVMGYLSGLNNLHMMTAEAKADPLKNLKNGDTVFKSIEKRCKNNDEADLSDAVTSIFIDLLTKGKLE